MTFSSLFGERLRAARKSLGLNQAQAADASGVSREYWGRCERGESVLGSEALAAFAAAGADALFVLTGQRGQQQAQSQSQTAGVAMLASENSGGYSTQASLSGDERELVSCYRKSSNTAQAALLSMAREIAKNR